MLSVVLEHLLQEREKVTVNGHSDSTNNVENNVEQLFYPNNHPEIIGRRAV